MKLARPMLQGVKCQILDGIGYLVTGRNKKDRDIIEPIKNKMVGDLLRGLPQFRGELVVGDPTSDDCLEVTTEALNQENLVMLFVLWVYDLKTTGMFDLTHRLQMAESFTTACGPVIQYADHVLIESDKALDEYKELVITKAGYPGIVLREPWGTFGAYDEEIKKAAATAG